MRKCVILSLVGLTCLGVLAGALQNGYGKTVTATTTPQSIALGDNDWAYEVSILNNGTVPVYCQKNVTTNDFVLTNAVAVLPGFPFTFRNVKEGGAKQYIRNVVVQTATNTAETVIAFN